MRERTEELKARRPGRAAVHPYDEWFDKADSEFGVDLLATEDFQSKVSTIRHNIYKEGKKRGFDKSTLTTVTLKDDKGNETGLGLRVIRPTKKNKK